MPLNDIVMTEGSFKTHEMDEWYPGELLRLEDGDDYGYGATIRWVIQLDNEEGETWALCSEKMSPRSKLYRWVQGVDASLIPDVDQVFHYQKLANRRVEVMFEQGETRENVAKIRAEKNGQAPIKGQQKRAAAAKIAGIDVIPDDESPF